MQSNNFLGISIGKKRITLERVASTNDYLKAELSKSTPFVEGTAIMAVEQFAGRGQVGSLWQSQKGKNLTTSILLSPTFLEPAKQFDLSIAISISIQQALSRILKEEVKIKWPNDIYVNNKKVGGILIENILQGSSWKYAIVGIGINVNQTIFPKEANKAGSLFQFLQEEYPVETLFDEICTSIEEYYSQLKTGNHIQHKVLYCNHLFGLNETREFKIDGITVDGKIKGVDENGLLKVDFNGHLTKFGFKEIEYVII